MKDRYIFIDTCVWYQILKPNSSTGEKVLENLKTLNARNNFYVIFTSQIYDEIMRNVSDKWGRDWIGQTSSPFKKTKAENFKKITKIEEAKEIIDEVDQANFGDIDNVISRLKAENDDLDSQIDQVPKQWKEHHLHTRKTIDDLKDSFYFIEITDKVVSRAFHRSLRGNPPHENVKDKQTQQELLLEKVADKIHWESILNFFKDIESENEIELVFVSENTSDWCGYSKQELHPYLQMEIEQLIDSAPIFVGALSALDSLSSDLRDELMEEESSRRISELESLVNELESVQTFDGAEEIMIKIKKYKEHITPTVIASIFNKSIINDTFSYGPYNQVLECSGIRDFLVFLWKCHHAKDDEDDKQKKYKMWRDFYATLPGSTQKRLEDLKTVLENNGQDFEPNEIRYSQSDDLF